MRLNGAGVKPLNRVKQFLSFLQFDKALKLKEIIVIIIVIIFCKCTLSKDDEIGAFKTGAALFG